MTVLLILKGTSGLTISWCKFLPGDLNNSFYKALVYLEAKANILCILLRNDAGLTKQEIMAISAPQKKTH